jgi:threonine aldolase
MPVATLEGISALAREHSLRVHLDGARLWNACAASGQSPGDYARHVDTVMVALSKALGCPVGSVLAGTEELMEEAWRVRRRLGGAMRQSGLLAAAGLYALDHHREAISRDHSRARRLAQGVGSVRGFSVIPPETNVVLIDVPDGVEIDKLLFFLEMRKILVIQFGTGRLRAVTHRDVDDSGIERAIAAFEEWSGLA